MSRHPDDLRRILKLLNSDVRRDLVRRLLARPDDSIAPVDFAMACRIPMSQASYHVRQAEALGAVKLIKTEPVKGTTKHYYGPTDVILSNRDLLNELLDENAGGD